MARVLARKPLDFFIATINVREFVDAEADNQLLESLRKHGQLMPLIARSDGRLIDGFRRLSLFRPAGIEEADVVITDEELTEDDIEDIQLVSAIHRQGLQPYELFVAFQQRLERNPGMTAKTLAERIDLDPSEVCRILSLSKGVDEVVDAARKQQIGVKAWSVICRHPPERQRELLAMKLSGASGESVARVGRKARKNGQRKERENKLNFRTAAGISFTVSGPGLTWESLKDAGAELTKEWRRASEQGVTLKNCSALMADRASKAGKEKTCNEHPAVQS